MIKYLCKDDFNFFKKYILKLINIIKFVYYNLNLYLITHVILTHHHYIKKQMFPSMKLKNLCIVYTII